MSSTLKKTLCLSVFWLLISAGIFLWNFSQAWWWWLSDLLFNSDLPQYEDDFTKQLTEWWYVIEKERVQRDRTLRENVIDLLYPSEYWQNVLYHVIRDITLWVMIIFIVWTWGSLLLNRKPEETKKSLSSLLYILLWWVFVYAANRLFWEVLHFSNDQFTTWQDGMWWFTDAMIWKSSVLFVILSAIKAFAFFLAIIMIVVTWFKVIAAWEWEKWKKLVKGLINVVVALLIIKWIDFIFYLAADSSTFVKNASDFIINAAKVFWYIYWVIIVLMIIVAWYLYVTDGWSGSNFKKACNILINILLSALVLFAFLLIAYQIFAEFQTWWDALIQASEQAAETPAQNVP
jgi:hypothetical protein